MITSVAVILVNFNGRVNTIACLASLLQIEKKEIALQIVIVENGSTNAEEKITENDIDIADKKNKTAIHVIESSKNSGFSGGNNKGIQYALEHGAQYLVILNNDTVVDKNFLMELLMTYRQHESIGAISPKIYFSKGYEYHKNRYQEKDRGNIIWYAGGIMDWNNVIGKHKGVDEIDKGQFDHEQESDYASGCCMITTRGVLKQVGMFDEKYFLYYEDSDLSVRMKKKGLRILFSPMAKVWHKNAGSTGGSGSSLQDYYITRNRLLFGFKYAPLRAKISLLKESIRVVINGRSWQKRGIIDFFTQRFYKGSFNGNTL